MKKILFLLLAFCLIFSSACSAEVNNSKVSTAKEVLDVMSQVANDVLAQGDKRLSATVVSVSGGTATVHLPTDPIGTDIVVQNSRELPLEIGDPVSIIAMNGDLSSAYVDVRRTINIDNIYVDYNIGADDYVIDRGTIIKPFKTLQFAINRLPKNLNGRNITIYVNNTSLENINIKNFYGGGYLFIRASDTSSPFTISSVNILDCMVLIRLFKVNINTGAYAVACIIDNCKYVSIEYLTSTSSSTSGGISGSRSQFIYISYSTLSNKSYGIIMDAVSTAQINNCTLTNTSNGIQATGSSQIYSNTNTGLNGGYGLNASENSTIGKRSTQPTGSISNEYVDSSSIIR
jgi:hypothetical protein